MSQSLIKKTVKHIGALRVSESAGVSLRAVYKWTRNGHLPKTEFTGETNYAEIIAGLSNGLTTASALLKETRQKIQTKRHLKTSS